MNPIPPANDDQLWRQMLEYLDGSLAPGEVERLNERLRNDAELRALFNDLATQQIKLRELAEEADMLASDALAEAEPAPTNIVPLPAGNRAPGEFEQAPTRSRSPIVRRRFRIRRTPINSSLALAASLALIGVVTWYFLRPVQLGALAEVEGNVTIERGDRKFAAHAGDVLQAGDRLRTGANALARFAYDGEATELSVADTSALHLDLQRGSKLVQLELGSFTAEVAKQQLGKPLKLVTDQTEAVVVGTRFKLQTTGAATRLEVFEGAVSILQSFEGPSLLVKAGNGATVIPGLPVSLQRLAGTRGSVLFEQWDTAGSETNQTYLTQFMFSGVGGKPGGSRVRGYLHPPRPGAYLFHLVGGSGTELWLSESDRPELARKIATSTDTDPVVLTLNPGQQYYIELRSPVVGTSESFVLSWTMPNGQKRVIYGDYLSPFDSNESPTP